VIHIIMALLSSLVVKSSSRFPNTASILGKRASRSFFSSSTSTEKARVAVIGSGRMGAIRGSILQANPKFDFAGVIDVNLEGATALANKYGVRVFVFLCI